MASFPQSGAREYRRSFSNWWWLGRRKYLIFILREFSSVFVAYFLVVTLEQVCALARGPEAYAAFQAHMRHPLMILLNIIALAFLVLHTITCSKLVPKSFYPPPPTHPLPTTTTPLPSTLIRTL